MTSSSTDARQIRRFGLVAFIFFGLLSALGWWKEKPFPFYFFGILALIGVGFILFPIRLRFLYTAWHSVAYRIGRFVNTVILVIAYYAVITPAALLKRVFGGRPLPTRPDGNIASYWIERKEPIQPRDRFLKRF